MPWLQNRLDLTQSVAKKEKVIKIRQGHFAPNRTSYFLTFYWLSSYLCRRKELFFNQNIIENSCTLVNKIHSRSFKCELGKLWFSCCNFVDKKWNIIYVYWNEIFTTSVKYVFFLMQKCLVSFYETWDMSSDPTCNHLRQIHFSYKDIWILPPDLLSCNCSCFILWTVPNDGVQKIRCRHWLFC